LFLTTTSEPASVPARSWHVAAWLIRLVVCEFRIKCTRNDFSAVVA
jgi:hypothetical protein